MTDLYNFGQKKNKMLFFAEVYKNGVVKCCCGTFKKNYIQQKYIPGLWPKVT